MKKLTITLAFVSFTLLSSAQLFVGGNLSLSTSGGETTTGNTTTDDTKYTNISIAPTAGLYITEQIAIGGSLRISGSKSKDPDVGGVAGDEYTSSMFVIAPFIRYDVIEKGDVTLSGQAQLGLGFGGSKTTSGGTTTDGPSIMQVSLGLAPVFTYDITEGFALEASLGGISLSQQKQTTEANTTFNTPEVVNKDNNFSIGINTSLSLGLLFRL